MHVHINQNINKKVVFLACIFVLGLTYLTSIGGVFAYKNATCIDSMTLQINTTKETLINSMWLNETSSELFHCSLGCSSVDGGMCRDVVQGAFPMEIFILIQVAAFAFMIMSFPFKSAFFRGLESFEAYSYEEVIVPTFATMFFFVASYVSLFVFSATTGMLFISNALFWMNNFLGFTMAMMTLVFSFNIMTDRTLKRRGL